MAIKGYFFNATYDSGSGTYDREYNAEDVTSYLSLIVGGGVFPNPSTNLQVMAAGGMNVTVKAGSGWFSDGHKIDNTADLPLVVSGSDILLNRIDRVVFYCDYVNRAVGIEVKEGTEAVTPTAPALVRDQSRYEYSLATIYIAASAASLSQTDITDTRPDSNVCGWVTGLIQQVDTATLFNQWQTAYEEFYADSLSWREDQESDFETWEQAQKDAFDAWLEDLTQELNVDTYIQNYTKSETFTGNGAKTVTVDPTGYTYAQGDIFQVFINGLLAKPSEYTLNTSGASPTVTYTFSSAGSLSNEITVEVFKSRIGFSH